MCDKILNLHDSDFEAFLRRGQAHEALGETYKAIKDYGKAEGLGCTLSKQLRESLQQKIRLRKQEVRRAFRGLFTRVSQEDGGEDRQRWSGREEGAQLPPAACGVSSFGNRDLDLLPQRQLARSMPRVKMWEDLEPELQFAGQDLLDHGIGKVTKVKTEPPGSPLQPQPKRTSRPKVKAKDSLAHTFVEPGQGPGATEGPAGQDRVRLPRRRSHREHRGFRPRFGQPPAQSHLFLLRKRFQEVSAVV